MFVHDILRCDSVTGAWWFPKQSVSLTEGLFVKESTWMNLSMSSAQRGNKRWREVEMKHKPVKRLGYRVLLRKRDKRVVRLRMRDQRFCSHAEGGQGENTKEVDVTPEN